MAAVPPTSSDSPNAKPYAELTSAQQRQRLKELVQVFLTLGMIAFGGPAAHIALMDDEVVKRRGWLTREKLLDLLGVTNLIPGPNSTELAIHIGYERAGLGGLILAGMSFILPAMLMVWGLAALYVHYQTLPQLGGLLYGIKPVIIAIVLQALWKLGQKAITDWLTALAALSVTLAFALGVNELVLLVLAGVAIALFKAKGGQPASHLWFPSGFLVATIAPTTAGSVTWMKVFLIFLKIGSVLYGGGYVLLAFLQRDLVDRSQWLTAQQLLDAIAIGQVTPGPVFTTATFVGYLLAGNGGAIAGTLGIFLPSFLLVFAVNPWVAKLRASVWTSGFLDGVNAASMGLMTGVTYTLARAAVIDWLTLVIAGVSSFIIFQFPINSVWLVLVGGVVGLLAQWAGFST